MIEPGKYRAKATGHEFGKTPNKGTRFIRVQFEITEEEFVGQGAHWDGWFTEKTLERTLDSLENCGWDGVSLNNIQGLGSKECVLDIEHEENIETGKSYPRVKWVNKLGGAAKLKEEHQLDKSEVTNLDREFRASLLERRQNKPRPAAPKPANGSSAQKARPASDDSDFGPVPNDDDIPF